MKKVILNFGQSQVSTNKIIDRIKTFEDACNELGIDPSSMLKIETDDPFMIKHLNAIAAFAKLTIIARALNEGWTPDWENSSEYKYWPYFKMQSGFGFSYSHCAYWFTVAGVGSRLCFKSEELAEYAAKQFESIYQEFLTV